MHMYCTHTYRVGDNYYDLKAGTDPARVGDPALARAKPLVRERERKERDPVPPCPRVSPHVCVRACESACMRVQIMYSSRTRSFLISYFSLGRSLLMFLVLLCRRPWIHLLSRPRPCTCSTCLKSACGRQGECAWVCSCGRQLAEWFWKLLVVPTTLSSLG